MRVLSVMVLALGVAAYEEEAAMLQVKEVDTHQVEQPANANVVLPDPIQRQRSNGCVTEFISRCNGPRAQNLDLGQCMMVADDTQALSWRREIRNPRQFGGCHYSKEDGKTYWNELTPWEVSGNDSRRFAPICWVSDCNTNTNQRVTNTYKKVTKTNKKATKQYKKAPKKYKKVTKAPKKYKKVTKTTTTTTTTMTTKKYKKVTKASKKNKKVTKASKKNKATKASKKNKATKASKKARKASKKARKASKKN